MSVLLDDESIDVARWTLRGPGGFLAEGSYDLSTAAPLSIPAVPVGTSYSLEVAASYDAGSGATCDTVGGPFPVPGGASTAIVINLICTFSLASCGGICGTEAFCGTWQSIALWPGNGAVSVGSVVTMSATARGSNDALLAYSWSISDSTIGHWGPDELGAPVPTTDARAFYCDRPGTAIVTVVVTDSGRVDASSCPTTASTATQRIQCEAAADMGVLANDP